MAVGYRLWDFLIEIFMALYEFGSGIYNFMATVYTVGDNSFTLFEVLFGPALIILLGFLIIKGLIF